MRSAAAPLARGSASPCAAARGDSASCATHCATTSCVSLPQHAPSPWVGWFRRRRATIAFGRRAAQASFAKQWRKHGRAFAPHGAAHSAGTSPAHAQRSHARLCETISWPLTSAQHKPQRARCMRIMRLREMQSGKIFALEGQIVLAKKIAFGRIIYQLGCHTAPTTQSCERLSRFEAAVKATATDRKSLAQETSGEGGSRGHAEEPVGGPVAARQAHAAGCRGVLCLVFRRCGKRTRPRTLRHGLSPKHLVRRICCGQEESSQEGRQEGG